MAKLQLPQPPTDFRIISNKAAFLALAMEGTLASLAEIPDPRYARNVVHPLGTILGLVFTAVLCGANNPTEIEFFGNVRAKALGRHLDLSAGVPTHDTITRVLTLLEPKRLDAALRSWVEAVRDRRVGRLVAIDGKTSRGAVPRGETQPNVHLVSAYCVASGTVLGQIRTAVKSNEITAIPELLGLLNLRGAVVSIDAAGCQTAIAAKIIDSKADYLLALKGNQPKLNEDAIALCTGPGCAQRMVSGAEVVEQKKRHGREETRRAWIYTQVEELHRAREFPGLAAVVRVQSLRRIGETESTEDRYYITSQKDLDAKTALEQTRGHWAIENQLHWMLDVVFREDQQRLQAANAVACLSRVRAFSLEFLKGVRDPKLPVSRMRMAACLSEEMFERIVFGVQ